MVVSDCLVEERNMHLFVTIVTRWYSYPIIRHLVDNPHTKTKESYAN